MLGRLDVRHREEVQVEKSRLQFGYFEIRGRISKRKLVVMTNPDVHAEAPVARRLEQQTAKLPSDLFLDLQWSFSSLR